MRTPRTLTANKWLNLPGWTLATVLLALITPASTLQAQVTNIIYQDNFARVGPLDGSAPDTVNAPGANWFACNIPGLNAQIRTDGSEIALTNTPGTTNGVYLNGFLPFVPEVGHIYYLSCNIKPLSGGTNWMALGFATHTFTNNFFNAAQCGSGWAAVRGNGTQWATWGSLSGFSNFTNTIVGNFQTFTVALDTTLGNANFGWQIRFYTNNVLVNGGSQTMTFADYPIKYVGIGADNSQGYFQNLSLIDVRVRNGTPTIIEDAQNATGQVGQTATFWVGVTNDYPVAAYQWATVTGGVTNAISGATNASYTTPTLDMSYNGMNYGVAISNINGSTNSAIAALTVVAGPPTVYSATKTASPTKVVVNFSKPVDPVTGLNAANYSLTLNGAPSGISVLSAGSGAGPNSVILTTGSALATNAGYYLAVQNVQDLYGNTMSTSTNPVLPAGLVYFVRADSGVVFDNSGTRVAKWLDQTTNANNAVQYFGVPSYGISGPATRPTTGTLNGHVSLSFANTTPACGNFLIAPSTPSLESMMSNSTIYALAQFTGFSPANEVVSKTWGNLAAPFDWTLGSSVSMQYGNGTFNKGAGGIAGTLFANTPAVITAEISLPSGAGTTNFNLYANGNNAGGGVFTAVVQGIQDGGQPLYVGARGDLKTANMKGQIAEILLFNTALSDADRAIVDNYLGIKYFTFAITTDLPSSTTSTNGFAVNYTFVAGAGSAHGFSLQWQENGTNIPGATSTSYTTPLLAPGDNGDKFVVQVTLPDGSKVYSTTNTLTVLASPPVVTVAGIPIWNTNQLVVVFDHAVNPATATVAANYSLNNGASVFSAAMGDLPNKVVLSTSPLAFNSNPGFYLLTVQNVQDVYGNTIVTASTAVTLYPNAALWLRANTGVTTDPGTNTVNQWTDLSGNNNTVFGGGGPAIQPVLVTNAWGDPVVRFNQTDLVTNYLAASSSSSLGITGDMSIIAVINPRALTGRTGHIVSKTGLQSGSPLAANIAAPYDYFLGTAGVASFNRGNGNGTVNGINYGAYTGPTGTVVGYPSIVAASDTGNTITEYVNAQPAGTGILNGNFSTANDFDKGQALYIGARSDGFNRLAGDLSELIVAASPMSSSEITALASYLSAQHHFVLFNPTPTNMVVSSSNNHISFSWPADHTGWQLQSNSVGLLAPGAWFTVSGSTSTNQMTITPNPTNGQVFYRMFFLQP